MDNVQFDENLQVKSYNMNRQDKTGSITKLFMKLGLAKDQKQENSAMLVIVILCLLLMTYFLISTYDPSMFNFSKPAPTSVATPWATGQNVNANQ
jgi:hypothetical protein